ncbi:hypothetical protein ATKI12_7000 [Kitasatospora sp. Ki12]
MCFDVAITCGGDWRLLAMKSLVNSAPRISNLPMSVYMAIVLTLMNFSLLP